MAKVKSNNEPATKKDVHNIVTEAVDAVLGGVEKMLEEKADKKDIVRVEGRIQKLDIDVSYVKDELKGIKADLSDTVSRSEFEKFKSRVSYAS